MQVRLLSKLTFVLSLAFLLVLVPGGARTRAAQPDPAASQGKPVVRAGNAGQFGGGAGSQMRGGDSHSPLGPSAPCEVSGLINADTTWSPSVCDPYVVIRSVDIQPGATLTITAGTTIKFAGLQVLAVAGTLVARGAAGSPITFTSNQPSAEAGDWGYIYFANPSTDATFDGEGNYTGGSIIQNAVIEYAGGASVSKNGALRIEASAPFIDDNKIRNNQGNGISIWSHATPHIKGNTITDNFENGIYVYDSSPTIEQGNTITGHSRSGIYVDSFFSGSPTIRDNAITGNSASQGGGIYIRYGTAIISGNIITGNSASRGGGIYLSNTGPTIQDNTITNNIATEDDRGGGIYLANSSLPTIHDNNLYANMTGNPASVPNDLYNGNAYGGAAVNARNNDWGTTDPAVIEDHIWHFLDDPSLGFVSYDPSPSVPCTILGIVGTDTTWSPAQCDPYIVTGHLSVQPGATLTIERGTTVKFDRLKVLAVAGTLVARGTDADPITFTSNQSSPTAGDWGYIYFSGSSVDATFDGGGNYTGGSIIQNAVIEYAGGASVSANGAVRIEASSPSIEHNTIENNQDGGVCVWNYGAPRIRDNTITNNSGAGIYVDSGSPIIQSNGIISNSGSGIYVYAFFSGRPTIEDNVITGNSASQGGGVYVKYGTAIIRCNIITGNSASRGGGIYVYSGSPPIGNNTITSNTASVTDGGGGIYLQNGSRPAINDNNLYANMTSNPADIPNDLYNGNIFGSAAVSATNNYWGTTDPAVIEGHVFHFPDSVDPLLGSVAYIPFRDSPVPPCTPASAIEVSISGSTTGITNTAYTFTATVGPLTAAQPITYAWQATGQSPVTHTNGLSDTATFTWPTSGPQVIMVTATNAEGTATDTHTITIARPAPVERVAVNGPTTGITGAPYTFSASASPLTATQPITYVWQATGQSPVPPRVDGPSDTVTFTWPTSGTQIITVTASNAWGSARANHTIVISPPGTDGDAYEPDGTCAQASLLKVDGTIQQHTFHQQTDQDWARFTAVSGIIYVLQAVSTSTGADLVLELYDVCDGNLLDSDDDAFGADARLTFAAPSSGVYYVKALNHSPGTYGPHVTYELSVRVSPSNAVGLIVAGHDDHYRLQSNILTCTNATFLTFLRGGLARTNLRYLSHIDDDAQTDADGDGVSDVDGDSTSTNVEEAITNWAANLADADTPFFLYLADHGGIDAFLSDGSGDTITPEELDGWLGALEDEGVPVNVVYEACHSGSFIDGLKAISRPRRVVIASTGRLNNAYPSRRGALFSDAFFTQLGQCSDLYTSFRAATAAVEATGLWQTPWLDDNGDRAPDERDGDLARQRGLPKCGIIDSPPVIDRVAPPASIVDGDGVLRAWVRDDGGAEGLEVWAFVYSPSFEEPVPSGDGTMPDLKDLPKVLFSDTNRDGEYVGLYEDFTEDGAYHVVVYAQDAAGNHALPAVTTVRTRWWVFLPTVVRGD